MTTNDRGAPRRLENILGVLGCGGLLLGIPLAIFLGRLTDWWVLTGLATFALLIVAALKVSSRVDDRLRQKRHAEIVSRLRPGARFTAHGSAGSPMEGRVIRVIDDDTIEASVGYASGGPKEEGPFPIRNIDSVEGDG